MEVTGKLVVKYDTVQVSEKFKKREFVISIEEEINGNTYTNFGKFQCVQNKCEIIDRFNAGDAVKVSFNIKGQPYVDKKEGTTKYISNLDAWRVEAVAASANVQAAVQQDTKIYTSAPTPAPVDDLPF